LTEDSIEIEVKWDSGNDGGGHLYMEIGILIMVSLYYNCKICNQTCQSQLTIFVHDIILVDANTWIDESILMDNCWKIENLSLIFTTDVINLYLIFEQGVKNKEANIK
jgi:hypothetical protein